MDEESETTTSEQRAENPQFLTQTPFERFDLPPEITEGLKDAGFQYCTPIQAQVLPIALEGRDVAGQAQTGTGKTAAFLVPLLTRILALKDRSPAYPSALIVAPTRELALQIYEDARTLAGHTGLSLVLVVGGIDYGKQADILRQGVDIVICTPGRIIDYIKQGVFKTGGVRVVVIDEADRLFDLGFTKDTRYILRRLPHYEKRLSMLFSATLSYRVLALTYDYMNLPEFVSVTPEEVTVEGIEQSLFHVGSEEKLPLLLGLLDREPWERILIFANTKATVEWLAQKLSGNGLPAEGITGDLPQTTRLKLMERFKQGKIKILVATDVASRGIHVEDISHVINYDLPQDAENYPHRIGRTARAGKTGRAISLACEEFVFHLEQIESMLGYKIPVTWPEDDWFKEDKSGHVAARKKGRPRKTEKPRSQPKEKKKLLQMRSPKKATTVSDPGGIFGLAPEKAAPGAAEASPSDGKARKKKRKRPRRRKKAAPPKEGQT
ncbi:MAG: DEAD/DEAH box helicase [Deltaproteobacteria bacterium]|nr:DEAD/DEAH box helicase [Deltaproteobacteria bacterium]